MVIASTDAAGADSVPLVYTCPPYGADGSGMSELMHLVVIPLSQSGGNTFGVGQVPPEIIRPIVESIYRMYLESHPHSSDSALFDKQDKVRGLIREFTTKYTDEIQTPLLVDVMSREGLKKRVSSRACSAPS